MNPTYLTEENASRKKITRFLNYLGMGAYKIGQHDGNILVQDRKSGKIIEEKIPIYIKLALRFFYRHGKGVVGTSFASFCQNITKKQGIKYSSAKSALWVNNFITYHSINMNDFIVPTPYYESFNEFFYRKLAVGARYPSSLDPVKMYLAYW